MKLLKNTEYTRIRRVNYLENAGILPEGKRGPKPVNTQSDMGRIGLKKLRTWP
ncbi:MAG: hypothetical protein QX199_10350 [Methylococcaceae bacterium]